MAPQSMGKAREIRFATCANQARGSDRNPTHELPYGPATTARSHREAGQMSAPDYAQHYSKILLVFTGASTDVANFDG